MISNSPSTNEAVRDPEAGSALIVVLWLSLILSLLAMGMLMTARSMLAETRAEARLDRAYYAAEAGVAIAAERMADSDAPWAASTTPYEATFDDIPLSITILPANARLDLNSAPPLLLANLFQELAADADQAAALADALADWRDEDDLVRLNGAERDAYLEAGLEGPANAPFENLAEFEKVIGFDAELVDCLRPFLTIYSGEQGIDARFAADPVRRAAGGNARGADAPPAAAAISFGRAYDVRADAPISDRVSARIFAVIRPTGAAQRPLLIHAWDRRIHVEGRKPPGDACFVSETDG